MLPKVWNMELPPYPREGLGTQSFSPNCQLSMKIRSEAARLARLSQLDLPENVTLGELKKFQQKLRKKLWEKMGCIYDPSLPLDVNYFDTLAGDTYTIQKLIYQSRPGLYVTALLYIPNGVDEKHKAPGVVHVHGHNLEGKINPRIQQTVTDLVQEGFVCLSIESFGTYERATRHGEMEYHGGFLGGSLFNVGESLMGAQLVDNMRGVDLISSLPFVRKDRIGATGASGGGNQTMYLAAMDSRIACAMPVVSVGSFEACATGINCICELLPDGLTIAEQSGVLALIAPRPLRIGNAFYDSNSTFSSSEMLKTYSQLEKLYQKLGCSSALACTIAPVTHGYHKPQREAMVGWFLKHLKGEGEGAPIAEKEYAIFPPEKLQIFAKAEDRPEKVRTIAAHCRMMGDLLREKMLKTSSFSAAEKRRELKKILRFRPIAKEYQLHKFAPRDGFERYALSVDDHLIPFLVRPGTKKGKFHLFLGSEGKNALTEEELLFAGKDKEATLVLFDPCGEGETAQSNICLDLRHQATRQLLWVGRSLPGEWVYDLQSMIRCLRQKFHAEELHITGLREAGSCAAFTAALMPEESFTVTALDAPASLLFRYDSIPEFVVEPGTPRTKGCLYSVMLAIPGFLPWGDMSLVSALAHGRVTYLSPRAYDGTPYTKQEKAAFEKEVKLLAGRLQ